MDDTDPLKRMRARAQQCRRLAEHVADPQTAATLRQMAEECEGDVKRLMAERAQ